jgi:hypothetical protein
MVIINLHSRAITFVDKKIIEYAFASKSISTTETIRKLYASAEMCVYFKYHDETGGYKKNCETNTYRKEINLF